MKNNDFRFVFKDVSLTPTILYQMLRFPSANSREAPYLRRLKNIKRFSSTTFTVLFISYFHEKIVDRCNLLFPVESVYLPAFHSPGSLSNAENAAPNRPRKVTLLDLFKFATGMNCLLHRNYRRFR